MSETLRAETQDWLLAMLPTEKKKDEEWSTHNQTENLWRALHDHFYTGPVKGNGMNSAEGSSLKETF